MKKIDNFILKKFQALSNTVQVYVGVTCFTTGRLLLIVWYILCLVLAGIRTLIYHEYVLNIVFVLLGIMFVKFIWIVSQVIERELETNKQFKNKLELGWLYARIMSVVFLGNCLLFWIPNPRYSLQDLQFHMTTRSIDLFANITQLCFFYFLSCTPLPPQKSKLKKFVEKMSAALSGVEPQLA